MTTNSVQNWINTAAASVQEVGARNGMRPQNLKTLKKWFYFLGVLLAGVWTLVMWGAYALLGLGDEAVRAGSQLLSLDARIVEWLAPFVGGTQQLGGAVVLVVWALGLVLLILGGWLSHRVIRAFDRSSTTGELHAP